MRAYGKDKRHEGFPRRFGNNKIKCPCCIRLYRGSRHKSLKHRARQQGKLEISKSC